MRVEKVDPQTGKISLGYRDLQENPWTTAAMKYPPARRHRHRHPADGFRGVRRVEPGIEGLVHISELSYKRVWRCSDIVKEGQQVEVMVLSVDADAQRISLSMKELTAPPEPAKKPEDEAGARPSPRRSTTSPPARCWAASARRPAIGSG